MVGLGIGSRYSIVDGLKHSPQRLHPSLLLLVQPIQLEKTGPQKAHMVFQTPKNKKSIREKKKLCFLVSLFLELKLEPALNSASKINNQSRLSQIKYSKN